MPDTLVVVKQLAQLTAAHSHNTTGTPLNAPAITDTGAKGTTLKEKYDPVIGEVTIRRKPVSSGFFIALS